MMQLTFREERGGGNDSERSSFEMKRSSTPEEERPGVDAGAAGKQPVEDGGLPSHVEGGQHQPSARQPRLVADPVRHRRLQGDTQVDFLAAAAMTTTTTTIIIMN